MDIEEEFPDLFVCKGRGLTVQLLHYAVYAGAGSCSGRMVKLVLMMIMSECTLKWQN